MQGKIKILESDNQSVVKEKKVFEDANIHFAGLAKHRITVKTKTKLFTIFFQTSRKNVFKDVTFEKKFRTKYLKNMLDSFLHFLSKQVFF